MITDFYDKVVIKIEYEGFYGSGILISNTQKTNSYLITAWHCLNEQTDIAYEKIKIFRQVEGCIKEIFLNFREKTILKENDIIIFTIDFLDDIPEYQIIEPEIREKVAIVGFPNALSSVSSNIKRYLLRGEINDIPSKSIIQINSESSFETYESTASQNVSGYSGSGVFIEEDNRIYLCGILNDLCSPEGAFSAINGISIFRIDDELFKAQNIHLPNIRWCSFNDFVQGTLEIFDDPLVEVCSVQIPEIIRNVTPKNIMDRCGSKIVWPYSHKSVLKNELWEAWLLYLIIRCIEDRENLKNENYYMIKGIDGDRSVKVFYVTNHTKLPDFLKDYLQNAYFDINDGELMIIKTDKTPAKKILPSSKINEIVTNISRTISVENHLCIDDVKSSMQHISLVHIEALIDEMVRFIDEDGNEQLSGKELERKLSGRILEVLHGI